MHQGGLDANGLPNAPATGNTTFTADTRGPVLTLDNLHDGDFITDRPAISGSAVDALGVDAAVRITGTTGGADTATFSVANPPGTFALGAGTLNVPADTDTITLSGSDALGNPGKPVKVRWG